MYNYTSRVRSRRKRKTAEDNTSAPRTSLPSVSPTLAPLETARVESQKICGFDVEKVIIVLITFTNRLISPQAAVAEHCAGCE